MYGIYTRTICKYKSYELRRLSTGNTSRRGINLTQYAAPLLLRLHPDTLHQNAPSQELIQENETAMKQLNEFLNIASLGCNNDIYLARKSLLGISQYNTTNGISWSLYFHMKSIESNEFHTRKYIIKLPAHIIRQTIATYTTENQSKSSTLSIEWQRLTQRILKDLFHIANIPLYNPKTSIPTALGQWLEESNLSSFSETESTEENYKIRIANANEEQRKNNKLNEELFHKFLSKDKSCVYAFTTGYEDGPTTQHVVLTNLVQERLILSKSIAKDRYKRVPAFNWMANMLLVHFMELRMHSLIWNKVILMISETCEKDIEVVWDKTNPSDGMAFIIRWNMDKDTLIDTLAEHTHILEDALEQQYTQTQKNIVTKSTPKKPKPKRRKHFYYDEMMSAMAAKR